MLIDYKKLGIWLGFILIFGVFVFIPFYSSFRYYNIAIISLATPISQILIAAFIGYVLAKLWEQIFPQLSIFKRRIFDRTCVLYFISKEITVFCPIKKRNITGKYFIFANPNSRVTKYRLLIGKNKIPGMSRTSSRTGENGNKFKKEFGYQYYQLFDSGKFVGFFVEDKQMGNLDSISLVDVNNNIEYNRRVKERPIGCKVWDALTKGI